ncbi:Lipoprotein-releasing system ATP-binding protein LolD [Candidatus Ornithobacterium hominis]|uniref:ABC transporter ATP-binding protein n=1 Tax=Candidatus Ornithobacterium hominis TaxID=2497989 RepID=UPI0024BCD9DD|nr:ABC transporter ATP-binding protein [Candidatus Ornithobacterium hominis]CAI9429056.1 Lipoprotein-releasing system ATP-binding protein LolD [Candidatus Ornithobacterium hominis]
MIEAKNIYKFYDELPVLKGVDLSIRKGEVVSIIGASGAGKTTLLQILGTLERPSLPKNHETELSINNLSLLNLKGKALSKFRNENIGFVFQFHQLLPEFTALENICMPGLIQGKSLKSLEKRGIDLLHFFGLKNRSRHKPQQLSGGEQQRVAVARALMNHPAVIFADEPSGNLDSKNADELHHLFFRLREEFQQTFVIVTHNKDLAAMADRKLIMQDGLFIP